MQGNYFDYFPRQTGKADKTMKKWERGVRKEHVSSESRKGDFGSQPNIQGRSPGLRKSGERSFSGAVNLN